MPILETPKLAPKYVDESAHARCKFFGGSGPSSPPTDTMPVPCSTHSDAVGQRVWRRCLFGSSKMFANHSTHAHTHTLRIGCTELKAVPHACLRNQILKSPGNPMEPGGLQEEVGPNSQAKSKRQGDGGTCKSAECQMQLSKIKIQAGTGG